LSQGSRPTPAAYPTYDTCAVNGSARKITKW
jgi:hypothetical protein